MDEFFSDDQYRDVHEAYARANQAIFSLKGLFPYQLDGVRWMLVREFASPSRLRGGILGDDVGLGKTVQMLAVIKARPVKTLICVPSALVEQWAEHVHSWLGCTPFVIRANTIRPTSSSFVCPNDTRWHTCEIAICTYTCFCDPLTTSAENGIYTTSWKRVVFDEAHRLRNMSSMAFWYACRLRAEYRWCLTATPVINKRFLHRMPHCDKHFTCDFGALLSLLAYPTYKKMMKSAGKPHSVNDMKKKAMVLAADESIRRSVLLRRTKADVHLPIPPFRIVVESTVLDPCDQRMYAALHEDVRSARGGAFLRGIMRLKQCCAEAPSKIRGIMKCIESYEPGTKALVFCNHRLEIDRLRDACVEFFGAAALVLVFDGRRDRTHGARLVAQYMSSQTTTIMIMEYRCGGVGLNLHDTHVVELASPHWAATEELQAIGRAHRANTKTHVTVRRHVARHTIEEFVHKRQESKLQTAAVMIGDPGLEYALRGDPSSSSSPWPDDVEMLGCDLWIHDM